MKIFKEIINGFKKLNKKSKKIFMLGIGIFLFGQIMKILNLINHFTIYNVFSVIFTCCLFIITIYILLHIKIQIDFRYHFGRNFDILII